MATQPYILSFDEAKRDTRARRPSSAAPESRPVIHSVDAIPAFESPFRQAGEGRGSARTAAHARPSGAARRSSAGAGDGSFARISTFDRPAGRHAAPRPASSSSRRASSSYGTGRFSSFDERIEEQPEEEVEERRLTRKEQRKKARAKSKAERAFTKQFGGSKPSDASQSGPRAAVYKAEMGAKHRQAARMQNATAVPRDGGSGVPAVRNLDPRMKLLIVLVVGSAALFSPHRALLLWCYAIIAALWLLSGEARRALGFVAVLAAVALAEWGAGFIPERHGGGHGGFSLLHFRALAVYVCADHVDVGGVAHR